MQLRNKFCFTGGLFEASVQLPGTNNVVGMWPAIWAMGNLGRAGYGATLEGMVRSFPLRSSIRSQPPHDLTMT
jgi:beta-glucanase (GH16 family)